MVIEQKQWFDVKIFSLMISAKPTTSLLKINNNKKKLFTHCLANRMHKSRELWPQKALSDRLFSDSCVNHTKAQCVNLTVVLCIWHCNLKLLCYLNILKCTLNETAGAATLLLENSNTCLRKTLRQVKELSKAARNHFQLLLCRYNLLSIPTFTCNGNRFAF